MYGKNILPVVERSRGTDFYDASSFTEPRYEVSARNKQEEKKGNMDINPPQQDW
jgi:hypothetical protein